MRIGVDFGGTKIEAAVIGDDGAVLARRRAPNPGAYDPALETVARLIAVFDVDATETSAFDATDARALERLMARVFAA